jgi:hypothetical protein
MESTFSKGARRQLRFAIASAAVAFAPCGWAAAQPASQPQAGAAPAPPVVYPSQGQTQEQIERDKTECYGWARQQTGYDPAAVAQAQPPAQGAPQGGAARGAAKGAAGGAAIGAIGGSPGTGAAAGAAAGAAGAGVRRRKEEAAQEQAATQQQQANAQVLAQYQRAFGACMEGRGYAVK